MAKQAQGTNGMKTSKLKVVCGTDFSQSATRAATAAAAIAVKLKEPLFLVHVLELPAMDLVGRDVVDSAAERAKARLAEEATRLRGLGAKVEEHFAIGSAYEIIADIARAGGVRMTVVASTKRSATERWLVGSVAERVAQGAPSPTLVVRDSALLESWAAGGRPLKILVAADFSYTSDAALAWVKDLQKVGKCSITVAYVNWIPEANARIGLRGPVSLLENAPEVQAVLERDLHEKAQKALGSSAVKVSVEPGWGRTDAHLIEMAEREEADLIVVGTHQHQGAKRLFSESVSRGALHIAPMNVAIVPATLETLVKTPITPTKRVLVTTDFSELGNRAVPYAYSLLSCGGKVCLVHVIEPFTPPNPLIANYQPSRKNKRQHKIEVEKLTEALRELIPDEAASLGIETEVHVVESNNVADGICHMATRFGADVTCVSSHGRSGIRRVLLGSVAQAVVSKTQRPVLIVRPQ